MSAPEERQSRTPRVLERALLLAGVAAGLSHTPSIVPRPPPDQALVSTAAGLMGAASGLLVEGATRVLPGGRRGATALLAALGVAGVVLGRRRGMRGQAAATHSAGSVLLASSAGGELVLAAWHRLPAHLRGRVVDRAWTTGLGAASAFIALRRQMAEPRDSVKASIRYEFLPSVSGGPGSRLPLESLDREGRKFLGLAAPAARIAEVVGEDAIDPIRVYAGLKSAAAPEERARLAVEELVRLGGLGRGRIVCFCPTGSGLVNPVAAEAGELLSRGDVASVVVQYSNKRSVRARAHLPIARASWRALLEALDRRLDTLPPGERPEVAVYGESLGAQVVAETLFEGGVEMLRALDIGRGVVTGLPHEGARKLRAIEKRGERRPEGVGVFTSLEELLLAPAGERERIRYLIFTHAEDPVALFGGRRLLWERPAWLARDGRHPRLPRGMRWLPGITFFHLLFDIKNATSYTPVFEAYAHDYRLELPTLLRIAFGHWDVTEAQLAAVEAATARSAVAQAEREASARVGPRPR